MFDWLFDGIEELVEFAVNGIILGIATILGPLIAVLPEMPALPEMPSPFLTAYEWVAWFFPVSTVLDILAAVLAFWLAWQLVVIALRWAKAVNDA